MSDRKYPTHSVRSHGTAKYAGSGSLNDRVVSPKESKGGTARGAARAYMHDGSRTHVAEDTSKTKRVECRPGDVPRRMFTKAYDGCNHEAAHGFRAHPKGVVPAKDWNTATLRFSGNSNAHRIGARAGGKFKKGK